MIKVAMIGAGSVVFSKNLTGDILAFPEFRDATLAYMDVDRERLEVGAALCHKTAAALGARPKIQATHDRRQALDGADFVINMVQVGGFDSTLADFEIPRKYGLNFTIADTTGPGGLFRALRTYPVLRDLCRDMLERCPRATLLNYANPMSMNMRTVASAAPDLRAVGLCHSVQGTLDEIMSYLGENPADIDFLCAGINHMAFYLRLEKNGHDLYPRLFQAMADPKIYARNKVRFELLKRLGHFVTESSEHNAEYSPWFIPHGLEHCTKFAVPIDEYLRRCDDNACEFGRLRRLAQSDEPLGEVRRSHEYGSLIIHSIATGTPRTIYGNMPNNGTISNLPLPSIAEAPTRVDRSGLRFEPVGDLPPQLVGYMQPHITQHELFIRAATEGRRDHVYQAAMFDPLTSATLTPDQIVDLCDELIAAHGFIDDGGLLPCLDAKRSLCPAGGKSFSRACPQELRRSWEAAEAKQAEHYLREWLVIGPFFSPTLGQVCLSMPTSLEDDLRARPDGAIDGRASYRAGDHLLRWHRVAAGKRGFVDLVRALGPHEWAVAYAYAEIESPQARPVLLRCGSDDGIRIWLNGQIVHENDIARPYRPDSDSAPVHLRAGLNRILVKVSNHQHAWGFGVALPGE